MAPHQRPRFILPTIVVAVFAVVGVTAAAASGRNTSPTIQSVAPDTIKDDPNPPPAPPEKAAAADAAVDLPRGGPPPDTHVHSDPGGEGSDDGVDWTNDPDVWVCVGPDDIGQARIVHLPSAELLKAMRRYVIEERVLDPTWTPTVEYEAAPPGCETIEGKPSLEDFYRDRTLLAVFHDDGSLKTEDELYGEAGS